MYNDPAGVLCLSLSLSEKKEGMGAEVRLEKHIKGQARAGGLACPPPVTWDGCYTCTAPTPLSQ